MGIDFDTHVLPGAAAAEWAQVDGAQWLTFASGWAAEGGVLLALWGSDERDAGRGFAVSAAFLKFDAFVVLRLAVGESTPAYPSLTPYFPVAERMERAIRDLLGLHAEGTDGRAWLRHDAWPPHVFPLRRDFDAGAAPPTRGADNYPFVRVVGDGVHEIPVGPVHAGIIEPGHFRFSVVGEKVLRLEERLGYVHKGIERRFIGLPLADGARLAARVSGDSAVAYAWAYCMALEGLTATQPPPRALLLRALLLERERIANHLGDLGALGNDAGFAFGLAQFSRLKEDVVELNARLYAARYPMDEIVPGGVAHDLDAAGCAAVVAQNRMLRDEVERLRLIYADHAGVQDRFVGAGTLATPLAAQLGVVGFAARASGVALDRRCHLPHAPYSALDVALALRDEGDVAARVAVRFEEIAESLRLGDLIADRLPDGPMRVAVGAARTDVPGVGLVEGWRGPVFVALDAGADGRVRRCHPHDPSWQNWPALEHAIIGNIVPDFPLINKSFNLSYSGHDL